MRGGDQMGYHTDRSSIQLLEWNLDRLPQEAPSKWSADGANAFVSLRTYKSKYAQQNDTNRVADNHKFSQAGWLFNRLPDNSSRLCQSLLN
eukprot:3815204-Amphidinium_carterae.2